MKRRWVKEAILLIASGLSVLVIAFFVIVPREFYNNPYNDKAFDRKVWLSAARSDKMHNPRRQMAEDLQKNYLRKGMTRGQVRRLLGKSNGEYDDQQGDMDWYFLGARGYRPKQGYFLSVHYDKSGNLISTQIYAR